MATKKPVKKTAKPKAATKKSTTTKPKAATKARPKSTSVAKKKPVAKKAVAKKTTAKKSTAKKAVAKKATAKKTAAKKTVAKKATAKKPTAKAQPETRRVKTIVTVRALKSTVKPIDDFIANVTRTATTIPVATKKPSK